MDSAELTRAYQQMGAAIAQLHTIHLPAFGELDTPGHASYWEALIEHARQIITAAHLRDMFFAALEKRAHLFRDVAEPCLCHEDLHKYNILFQCEQGRWQLATILDFEKAWAGQPETDLARLELWRGMTSPAFWAAYESICPRAPLYPHRRPIYQLLWCLEYASPTPEHLADTRRVCAELGIPFDHFEVMPCS
jgi:aminoglycoside phosphotransferase (APT) family kinase protein